MYPSLLIPVVDKSQASGARRLAAVWTRETGCDEDHVARISLVVTELANNLHLHTTRGGNLVLRRFDVEGRPSMEILSLDSGPGTANFSRFMRDGFSTSGTMGTGLGAVQRHSRVFEVHSQPGLGTALLSQVWPTEARTDPKGLQVGAVNLPIRNETVSGDSWCFCDGKNGCSRLIIADGLGHGPAAAEASRQALAAFTAGHHQTLPALMAFIHEALRSTRGAAVAVAELDLAQEKLRYVGVGNIAATVLSKERTTSLVSMNGTVGANCHSIQEFTYPCAGSSLLVMSSDGLKTQWNLARYQGLQTRHPSLVAGVLYRDYNRGTDDITVAAIRSSQ